MIHGTAFSAHDMGSFAYLVHKPSGTLLSIPRALYVDLATYPEAYGDGWQAMLDETADRSPYEWTAHKVTFDVR